jgi:GT2 family glycosyltransferase
VHTEPPEGLKTPQDISFATGCVFLFSAQAIQDVGTFAEDFFAYVEDAELCVRLKRAGYRILFEPRAKALHRTPRIEDDPAPYKIRLRDRNRRRVIRRHFGAMVRIPFLARFFLTRIVLLMRYTVRLDWPRAAAVVRGMVEP